MRFDLLLSVKMAALFSVLALFGCQPDKTPQADAARKPSAAPPAPADDGHSHAADADDHEHADEHAHGDHGEMQKRVNELASFDAAMQRIEQLRRSIADHIDRDELLEVHPPAEEISLIASRLPELASKSNIPRENWKAINVQSRELASLFREIDAAADAKKKVETEAVFERMGRLIEKLREFAQ